MGKSHSLSSLMLPLSSHLGPSQAAWSQEVTNLGLKALSDREEPGRCWGRTGAGVGGTGWAASAWMPCPHGAPGRRLLPHGPHPGAEFGPRQPTDGGHAWWAHRPLEKRDRLSRAPLSKHT